MAGLRKGFPKQRSPNKVQELRQEPNEYSFAFLEHIYQAYRKYTDLDPEAPENFRMINMTFISQSAPDIKRKLNKSHGGVTMNSGQLVETALKVYSAREECKSRPIKVLEAAADNRDPFKGNSTTKSKGKKKACPRLERDQCAYCKEEGHWNKDCPKFQTR